MRGVVVRPHSLVPTGQVLTMANYEHPETPMFEFSWGSDGLVAKDAEIPDGVIVSCNPSDEQMVRNALAIAQERAV